VKHRRVYQEQHKAARLLSRSGSGSCRIVLVQVLQSRMLCRLVSIMHQCFVFVDIIVQTLAISSCYINSSENVVITLSGSDSARDSTDQLPNSKPTPESMHAKC
jgi:hypothetical protein